MHARVALLAIAVAIASAVACRQEDKESAAPHSSPGRPAVQSGQGRPPVEALPAAAPSIHLKVYPDMAVPGSEVVVEAQLVPPALAETPEVHFAATADPCQGELLQEGARAVYKVPPKCRGSGITIEVTVAGTFGQLKDSVTLDIKKSIRLESVVISYPQPNERVVSPVQLMWDKTLYENRKETLSFKASRGRTTVLETGEVTPDTVLELDVPPSPDPLLLTATVSGGSVETASLRVFERASPAAPGGALVIDDFQSADANSLGRPRRIITTGGDVVARPAERRAADGATSFLALLYHVNKSTRLQRGQTLMGIEEEVGASTATAAAYADLRVWLRGDPVRGFTTPVYVAVEGSRGSKRVFKIVRLKPAWTELKFPLSGALRRGADEHVRRVSIYVDSKDVFPPLAYMMFGGIYLSPRYDGKASTASASPPGAAQE